MRALMIALVGSIFLMGAECVPGTVDLPYEQTSPDITIDIASQVSSFESAIANGGDENRAVLTALCMTESGRACDPPTLPTAIPRSIPDPRVGYEGQDLDVTEWLSALPALDELKDISQAISLDIGAELGLSAPDQVQAVTITSVVVKFKDNSLTVPMPPMDLYAGSGIEQSSLDDAAALIESGKVTHFGALESIPGGDTIAHPMDLNDAGKQAFSDALMSLDVALALRSVLDFPPAGDGPIAKPDGIGTLNATITATFTVSTGTDFLF